MLGFIFENSILKAVLDAQPKPIFKVIGLNEQLKTIKAGMDQIQTNLAQIRAHAGMPKVAELD